MHAEIIFLGGAGEIGANSTYLNLDGSGVIIDAGLHPVRRDMDAFPDYTPLETRAADLLLISHAHTDHIGGIPFLIKKQPQLKMLMTYPTRDLMEIMLRDTAKLLKSDVTRTFGEETLSLYKPEILEKINLIADGWKYGLPYEFTGRTGLTPLSVTFAPSGHILGSASIYMEFSGKSILHTSDINFRDQNIIKKAELPVHHLDVLVIECTNAANDDLPPYESEIARLAFYINGIVNDNGSILIPVFALGKSQELLKILFNLMKKGRIPSLPVYTAGLIRKISILYDRYCYTTPRIEPGFEIGDIPQIAVKYDELATGDYFREPSIVLVPSGMMNKGTTSYWLAQHWFRRKNFGIALVGYQDETSPGCSLSKSERGKEFDFGGKRHVRHCDFRQFRFTSHAVLEDLLAYIASVKPKRLFIIHGSTEAAENLAWHASESSPETIIHLPEQGVPYRLY